jgi:V-type H+-transporting ATPase subunit G
MASQTQGIQQLLSAEKRAAEKVSEARKRKNRRLKQAKEEAQAEIEKYKSERETQFREHEARYAGSKGDVAARIDADAKARIEAMNISVNANKNQVNAGLLEAVCNIEPRVHVNYRPTG